MIGIGNTIPIWKYKGAGFSPEALAWKGWIEANGGTIPNATLAIFDEELITPAVSAGIWAELDRLNVYCGLNGYEIAARTNMIKNAHYVTPVSSPIFDNNGYRSAGAGSYLNLNYNPSTQAVKLQRNSSIQACYVKDPPFLATRRPIGGATFTGITTRLDHIREFGQFTAFQSDVIGSSNTNTVTSGIVLLAGRRTAASGAGSKQVIINSNVQNFSVSSTQLPNLSLFELTPNYDGLPNSDVDTNSHYASYHGSSALDYSTLDTLLRNTFTALGL